MSVMKRVRYFILLQSKRTGCNVLHGRKKVFTALFKGAEFQLLKGTVDRDFMNWLFCIKLHLQKKNSSDSVVDCLGPVHLNIKNFKAFMDTWM
jgi:hypothetical protein